MNRDLKLGLKTSSACPPKLPDLDIAQRLLMLVPHQPVAASETDTLVLEYCTLHVNA